VDLPWDVVARKLLRSDDEIDSVAAVPRYPLRSNPGVVLVSPLHTPPRRRCINNTAGDIFIDGHNIKKLDLKCLRRNIASVSQEPSLFASNIKDNLRIGKMDASDEEITEAATTANVHSFISKLPNEYLTEVILHSLHK
jgi:hypothetical protein